MPRKPVALAAGAGRNSGKEPYLCVCETMAHEFGFYEFGRLNAGLLQKQLFDLFCYLDYLKRNPSLPRGDAQRLIDRAERKTKTPDKRLKVFSIQPGRQRKDAIEWNLVYGLIKIWDELTGGLPRQIYWLELDPQDFSRDPKGCYTGEFFSFVTAACLAGGLPCPSGRFIKDILKTYTVTTDNKLFPPL